MGAFVLQNKIWEGERMKIKLLTKWHEKEMVCCCPPKNRCSKDHRCEELEFILDPFADIEECMGHDAYRRGKHGIRQVRNG